MPSVVFIENPTSPGSKQEMERLRRENNDLKKQLNEKREMRGEAPLKLELDPIEDVEAARTFKHGLCTITIKPLIAPVMMNPEFAGIVNRTGPKKKQKIHESTYTESTKNQPVYGSGHAETEEDDAAVRFQLLELDR